MLASSAILLTAMTNNKNKWRAALAVLYGKPLSNSFTIARHPDILETTGRDSFPRRKMMLGAFLAYNWPAAAGYLL